MLAFEFLQATFQMASEDVIQVAQIVKMVMENSCKLSVQTPIKIAQHMYLGACEKKSILGLHIR